MPARTGHPQLGRGPLEDVDVSQDTASTSSARIAVEERPSGPVGEGKACSIGRFERRAGREFQLTHSICLKTPDGTVFLLGRHLSRAPSRRVSMAKEPNLPPLVGKFHYRKAGSALDPPQVVLAVAISFQGTPHEVPQR